MKKRVLTLFLLTVFTLKASDPELKKISLDGFEREYLLYTPPHAKPNGIIVALHGFNGENVDFFGKYSIRTIADEINYIILAPQAIPEQDASVKSIAKILDISMDAVWACGLRVIVPPLLDVELNKNVKDVEFIEAIVRKTIQDKNLSEDNIFLLGLSMGGYMSYQYAMYQPLKLSGVISVAGSMGLNIRGKENKIPVPVCNFHSETDEVVPYNGTRTILFLSNIKLAEHTDSVISYWRSVNKTTRHTLDYSRTDGSKTVEKHSYEGSANEVINYKINGAGHSYFFSYDNGDCMDYIEEITAFIQTHATANEPVTAIGSAELKIWPNPAYDVINLNIQTGTLTVFDMSGRMVLETEVMYGKSDISALPQGVYVINVNMTSCVLIKK